MPILRPVALVHRSSSHGAPCLLESERVAFVRPHATLGLFTARGIWNPWTQLIDTKDHLCTDFAMRVHQSEMLLRVIQIGCAKALLLKQGQGEEKLVICEMHKRSFGISLTVIGHHVRHLHSRRNRAA
jgi:hypothetical protein